MLAVVCGSLACSVSADGDGDEEQQPALRVSRTSCVSPCTVMFSIDGMQDDSVEHPFVELGVTWDYDDPEATPAEHGAEAFARGRGAPRTHDGNTPLGMHTYACAEDSCTFHPRVLVLNPLGELVTVETTVEVRGQDAAFPQEHTVCVSHDGVWDGDVPCPAGAQRRTELPALGAWESDTRYLLRRGDVYDEVCLQYELEHVLIGAFGDEAAPLPELRGEVGIGRDRSCSDALPTTTDFETPGWIRDVTLTGLRVQEVGLGMTFEDVTLHGLDMDWENEPSGGRIRSQSTDACSKRDELDCGDVPLPRGLYITDSRIIGSRTTPPGLNVEFLSSSCVSFFGVMNIEASVAIEHNIRLECGSRVLVMHSDVNGEHIGAQGPKNGITIRPEGHDAADMLGQMRRDTSGGFGRQFENKFVVIKDNYLGQPDGVPNNAARITVAPSKAADAESTYAAVVSGNITDLSPDALPDNDIVLSGRALACYDDNQTQTRGGCSDGGQNSIPAERYSPALIDVPVPPAPSL